MGHSALQKPARSKWHPTVSSEQVISAGPQAVVIERVPLLRAGFCNDLILFHAVPFVPGLFQDGWNTVTKRRLHPRSGLVPYVSRKNVFSSTLLARLSNSDVANIAQLCRCVKKNQFPGVWFDRVSKALNTSGNVAHDCPLCWGRKAKRVILPRPYFVSARAERPFRRDSPSIQPESSESSSA